MNIEGRTQLTTPEIAAVAREMNDLRERVEGLVSIQRKWRAGLGCGNMELIEEAIARVVAERDKAVAFASKVERGEVSFAQKMDEQLAAIAALPLYKRIDENLSQAVERVLREREDAQAKAALWGKEREVIKGFLFPGRLSYEPNLGVCVVAGLEALKTELEKVRGMRDEAVQQLVFGREVHNDTYNRLERLLTSARGAAVARARWLANDYLPWQNAGGLEECAHGRAAGVACPKCDRETVEAFFASLTAQAPPEDPQDASDVQSAVGNRRSQLPPAPAVA